MSEICCLHVALIPVENVRPHYLPLSFSTLVWDWVLLPGRDFQDGGECCSSIQPAFSRKIVCQSSARGFLRTVSYPFYFAAYLSISKWQRTSLKCMGRLCNNNRHPNKSTSYIGLTVTTLLTKILNLAEFSCCIPRLSYVFLV